MLAWRHVTSNDKCCICGKADWCAVSINGAYAICRRIDNGSGKLRVDKSGAEYWMYSLSGSVLPDSSTAPLRQDVSNSLPAHTIDRAYKALLSEFSIADEDVEGLVRRGFTAEQIRLRGYRTLPERGRSRAVSAVIERLGVEVCERVPGFIFKESDRGNFWTLLGGEGLLIPVRNSKRQIVALKVRRRTDVDPKYAYVSSTSKGGNGPGSPVHVSLSDDLKSCLS